MTIEELIRDLQALPPKSTVVITHHEDGDLPVTYAVRLDDVVELYGDWDTAIQNSKLACMRRVNKQTKEIP